MSNNHQQPVWRDKVPVVIKPATRTTLPVTIVSKSDSYIELPAFETGLLPLSQNGSCYYAYEFFYQAPFDFSFNELPILPDTSNFFVAIRYSIAGVSTLYLLRKPDRLPLLPIYIPFYDGHRIKKNFALLVIPAVTNIVSNAVPLRFRIGIKHEGAEVQFPLFNSINVTQAGLFTFTDNFHDPIALSPIQTLDTN